MSKSRYSAPRVPPRPGRSVGAFKLLSCTLLGAIAGAGVSYHFTNESAARACRLALEAQVAEAVVPTTLAAVPHAPTSVEAPGGAGSSPMSAASSVEVVADLSASAVVPSASASSVAASSMAAVAGGSSNSGALPSPARLAVQAQPVSVKAEQKSAPPVKPAPKPVASRAEPPSAIRSQSVSSVSVAAAKEPPSSASMPKPAPPAASQQAPAEGNSVDHALRNPAVLARVGSDVVFIRINEKTTLQVKKGQAVPGLGALKSVDSEGAHFDSVVVPHSK